MPVLLEAIPRSLRPRCKAQEAGLVDMGRVLAVLVVLVGLLRMDK